MPLPPHSEFPLLHLRQPWRRVPLPLCILLLLFFLLLSPAEKHQTAPPPPVATAGLCSGDCNSCGCPPAVAARGDCCCTLSRRLAGMSQTAPAATGKVDVPADGAPSFCRLPCGRSPAAAPTSAPSLPLLATSTERVPGPCAGPLRTWIPLAAAAPRSPVLSPDLPPPEHRS